MDANQRETTQKPNPTQAEYNTALEAVMDRYNALANDAELGPAVAMTPIEIDAVTAYTLAVMVGVKGMPVAAMMEYNMILASSVTAAQTIDNIIRMAYGLGVKAERSARRG